MLLLLLLLLPLCRYSKSCCSLPPTTQCLVLADSTPNKIKMDDLLSIFKACLAYGVAWVNFGQHRSAFGTMLVQNVSYELLKNVAHEALMRLW